jgi:hypothetical protein
MTASLLSCRADLSWRQLQRYDAAVERMTPICPSCGMPFDEGIPDRAAGVILFGHAGPACEEVYGRGADDPTESLVRLGTIQDFGTIIVGRNPESN